MKKLQTVMLAAAVGCSLPLVASAQDRAGTFDDRWYLTAGAGYNAQDGDRHTDDTAFGTLGFGKFVNPNWSVDAELNYQNPHSEYNHDLNYSQYGLSIDARRHFRREGRTVNPYIVGGVGYQRAEEEYVIPSPTSPAKDKRGYATAKLGVGLQADWDRVSLRGELAGRYSFDGDSVSAPNESGFVDGLASLTLVVPLGARTVAAVPPPIVEQPVKTCADLDDDGDGVNNCDDKCPASQAGQTVGPDGCPVPVTIDLRGVNFEFDKSTLTAESRAILDDAIGILQRYPDMNVQVAGHTDSIGTEQYNRALSERRAKAVYDYLTAHGISSDRLTGPIGYGESRPIAPNTNPDGSDNPEGRAKNRRTELNVENGVVQPDTQAPAPQDQSGQ